jgi:hypothetical protein
VRRGPRFDHPELLTRAEHSRWKETSRHAEVEAFCWVLSLRSPRVTLLSMGKSGEGRDMPVLVLSSGGASTPAAAHRKGRAVVLVQANIHAGEVEGKEAVLMLARDLALARAEPALLRRLTLVLVPDFNPDGNDRISRKNRALDLKRLEGQVGPPGGVGTRYTGQGWNLNRDHVKHDAPEMRNMARLFREWNPHLFVDCHTTDGSIHGFDLTFDTAHNPLSGHPAPIALVRDGILPEVARGLRRRTGIRTGFYGNFVDETRPEAGWATYPALPRFGSHYRGLCGRGDVLLETYSYIDFETRCRAILETLRELFAVAAKRRDALRAACDRAARETTAAGLDPRADDLVGINYGVARRDDEGALVFDYPAHAEGHLAVESVDPASVKAHRLPGRKGVRRRTYLCPHVRRFLPVESVSRPFAYLVPPSLASRLDGHGISWRLLGRRRAFEAEAAILTGVERTRSPDIAGSVPPADADEDAPGGAEGPPDRWETVLTVRRELRVRAFPPGTLLVPTAQPLGNLVVYLLEPESDDGFARWGFLDEDLRVTEPFPIWRVMRPL